MPTGIYIRKPFTYEHRKGIGDSKRNKKRLPFSEGWRRNLRNASLEMYKNNPELREIKRKFFLEDNPAKRPEVRKKLSLLSSGENNAMFGKKYTLEQRKEMSELLKGENSPHWRGGINPINDTIRKGIEFRLWREAVFARDNWTCQKCRKRNGTHHPHHIQNFAEYPELRFAIDNGITFCKNCHEEFHKIYGYTNNTKEQVEQFIKSR